MGKTLAEWLFLASLFLPAATIVAGGLLLALTSFRSPLRAHRATREAHAH